MKICATFTVRSGPGCFVTGCRILVLITPLLAIAAAPKMDIIPPQRRQAAVDTAERLAQRKAPDSIPTEQPSPFNPSGFEKTDPADNASRPSATAAGPTPAPTQAAPTPGDREILESLAARIPSTGIISRGGKPMLAVAGGKILEVGTKFTVTFNDQDYELELVAIDRTTFTLRYRNEETTRPIKLVR
jgi:hypothetical protein